MLFNWYTKYNNNNYTYDPLLINKDILITKLKTNANESNIDYKISVLEQNYYDKIDNIKLLCNDNNKINEIKKQNSYNILKQELEIIKTLTKYTRENKIINYDFIIECLSFILILSDTLKNRINQKDIEIINKIKTTQFPGSINRCSYKFCDFKEKCIYNYDDSIRKICYQDHYVHNMVSSDIKNLINFIKNINKTSESSIMVLKEIIKTINTLSFVISHMETELNAKCFNIKENEWEQYHKIKK